MIPEIIQIAFLHLLSIIPLITIFVEIKIISSILQEPMGYSPSYTYSLPPKSSYLAMIFGVLSYAPLMAVLIEYYTNENINYPVYIIASSLCVVTLGIFVYDVKK
jgi:hypothetical protein